MAYFKVYYFWKLLSLMKEVSGILQIIDNTSKVWDCVTDSVKIVRSS